MMQQKKILNLMLHIYNMQLLTLSHNLYPFICFLVFQKHKKVVLQVFFKAQELVLWCL